jgi:hypothetical protein
MSSSRIAEEHDVENPNLDNAHPYRRRVKSQPIPEFKMQKQDIKEYVTDFFRNKSSKELAVYFGARAALIATLAYGIAPVSLSILRAFFPYGLIAGGVSAAFGVGGKFALEKYEENQKLSSLKGPLP